MYVTQEEYYKYSTSLPKQESVGWFAGFLPALGKAPISGLALGAGIGAATAEEAFRPVQDPVQLHEDQLRKMSEEEIESTLGRQYAFRSEELADFFRDTKENAKGIVKWAKPDSATTGAASQLVFGLGQILTAGAVGGVTGGVPGAVVGIGATQGYNTYLEVEEQTKDKDAAYRAGWYSALANAVGAGAPAYVGKTLATQMATGAAINLATGMAERGSIGAMLRSEGYDKAAQSWQAMDGQAAVADMILGVVFPLGAKALSGMKNKIADMHQSEIDAAIALRMERDAVERLPEIPTDMAKLDELSAKVANDTIDIFVNGKNVFDVEVPRDVGLANPELGAAIRVADEVTSKVIVEETGIELSTHLAELDSLERARSATQERSTMEAEGREKAKDGEAKAEGTAKEADTTKAGEEKITGESFTTREAQDLLRRNPDMIVKTEAGDVRLADLLKQADEMRANSEIDAKLHRTAIACALNFI